MSSRSNDTRGNAALIENLEDRKLMAAVVVSQIKIAKAQDTDGTALNQNRITIGFTGNVRLGDVAKFSSFGYANDLTNINNQIKKRVTLTITQIAPNGIQILTDRLIRKGSRLTILAGGLTDTKGNAIIFGDSNALTFTTGQNKPRYSLANRNFAPTDLSIVDKDVFASAPTPVTANVTPSASTVRTRLIAFLNAKVATKTGTAITQAQATTAINLYDSSATAAIVPNASLRAALVSLVGTAGEPAINSFLAKTNSTGKPYTVVDFGTVSSGTPVGETQLSAGGRLNLTINSTFAGEPFQVLSATLAHEAMHQDPANNVNGDLPAGQDEEIIANAVETVVYAQQLLVDPSVAANGTKLVVRTNTRLLALLNSGDKLFPYGGIFQAPALSNNGNVFVGGKPNPGGFTGSVAVPSFENWIRREYISRGFAATATPVSVVGQAILKNIVGTKSVVTSFNAVTETALDTSDAILTDITYIRLANILKLAYS